MSTRLYVASPLLLLASCTCGEPPQLNMQVVDLWDQPVEGVSLSLDGAADGPTTNATGHASRDLVGGQHTISASKSGWIAVSKTVAIEMGPESIDLPITIWPQPESNGLWLIGESGYEKIEKQGVVGKGDALQMFYGVPSTGQETSADNLRVVLHNEDLKMDEVMRLGYELHKMKYVTETTVKGVEGDIDVDVNLWLSDTEVDIGLEQLGDDRNYLITPDAPLEAGTYAFQTFEVLTPNTAEVWNNLHEDIRQAYAFEVK